MVEETEVRNGLEEQRGGSGWLSRLLPVLLLVLATGLFFGLGLDRYVSLELLRENRDLLTGFVTDHYLVAALVFIGLYAVVTGLSVPGAAVLTLSGGFLFGTVGGTAYAVIGATLGATAIFLAARTAFADVLRRRAGRAIGMMREGFRKDAFNYLLFLRLVPAFPFFLVNLVPAFLGVSTRTYVLATVIGIIPGGFVFASVGAGLGSIFDQEGEIGLADVMTPEIILAMVGLGVLALVPVAAKRFLGRKDPRG
ncbi:TVP38/TMEM64 family protein [Nisaea acidiphila]|uniref:TVP38/TMEM64 family membrane protein n=1 Tax=Nisaea acidiphila TaxID=1862145 RepID=A0A9J7AKV3_9PROT|nr:TVP38/TMEM64 family protein [Nisaea acidiphila]UUX48120.1 TVP38/TMEM64 family protein [Nisaea acidiphila]